MRVYRLSKKKYSTALSGKGAAKSGNRWNSKGTEMIYTAESRALAMAEVAVHVTLATLPSDFVMMEIYIPNGISLKSLQQQDCPEDWNTHPPGVETQKIGDAFIHAADYCVFNGPSAVVQGDANYLLNPFHRYFNKIQIAKIQDFIFDKRIFQ